MSDEKKKLTSSQIVRIVVPKNLTKGKSNKVRRSPETYFGPFSRIDEDEFGMSPGKVRIMDMSSYSKVKAGRHDATHDVDVPVILGAASWDSCDGVGSNVSYDDLSEAGVLANNRALLQQRFHPDNIPVELTEGSGTYRTFPGNWPLPWKGSEVFDVTVEVGGEAHKLEPGGAWKDGHDITHIDSEAYGYVDYDPDLPSPPFTPRPDRMASFGANEDGPWGPFDLPDPPAEPVFDTAYPFGSLYEESMWQEGRLYIKKMKGNSVAVKTGSVFYEPFSTDDKVNYKVTKAEDGDGVAYYDAAEVALMKLGKDEFDLWLVPQTWKFDLAWSSEVLFMWSSRNHPLVAPALFFSIPVDASGCVSGFPLMICVGQYCILTGARGDFDEETGEGLRDWFDETRGYYICTTEPGMSVGDYLYVGGRPHWFSPEADYITNHGDGHPATLPEHDIPEKALDASPFELQKCRTASKQFAFSVSGYKKAQTKPIFPRQVRRRTQTPNVLRVIGNDVAGVEHNPGIFDHNNQEGTGTPDEFQFRYNGPYFTSPFIYSPVGDAYHPNPDSSIDGFDFNIWTFVDTEYKSKVLAIPATSVNDLTTLATWVENSRAFLSYMSSQWYLVWWPDAQYYNRLAATVDSEMNTPSNHFGGPCTLQRYTFPNNCYTHGGPWRSYGARFTVAQVNTPAKSLVGCIATRNADGSIKDKRYIWRKTASTGRSAKVVDNQPFDSVIASEADMGRCLRSAAKGNWDPNGAVGYVF